MKLIISLTIVFFFMSCSGNPPVDKPAGADNAVIEKNKQTAVLNEVSQLTRTAQRLERQGRDMDSYRLAADAESKRICNVLAEDRKRETADLETKIKNLPEIYNGQLMPILPDINECVTCSKKAMESCVKARASINETIKRIFPQ